MRLLELVTNDATVAIAPEVGGSIVSFDVGGRPILRPTPQAALEARDVRDVGCYPLVPYSNRIRNARLDFGGRHFELAHNFGNHPHSIHGVGWQRAWTVAEASPDAVRLAFSHDARGDNALAWPWPFEATQAFHLAQPFADHPSVVLVATLALRNTGTEAFPFGLGFHPFFPKRASTRLAFHAERVWKNDATQLPHSLVAIPPDWHFDPPRALDAIALDNVFTDWRGSAALDDDTRGASIRIDADRALAFVVVYAPPAGDFVAIEPVTHETDAFNRSAAGACATGMRILAPGAAFSCTMRITAAVVAGVAPPTPAR